MFTSIMYRINVCIIFFFYFNPFGQFIHSNTKMLKHMWINVNSGKELLHSYDIENENSNMREYKL